MRILEWKILFDSAFRHVTAGRTDRNPNSALRAMDTQSRYFRIRRQDIAFFKFIIESYEGMAVLRTTDPHEAVVELMVAPGWEKAVDEVLEGLRQEIRMERISLPESESRKNP